MPLHAIGPMMRRAREHGYAIGYFESWNLESLQGVLDAAEQSRSPVIVGWNGEFLSREGRLVPERLALYAALGKAAAEAASIPCALLFNECSRDEWTRQAIGLGFNLVMPVAGADDPESYMRRVAQMTRLAHERNVAVEAEIGELPHGESSTVGSQTDPDVAQTFVEETGIDLLAVSVGNVHILLEGERGLDLDRLEAIYRRVRVPLALHGGSGIARAALRDAIRLGVSKVNYGTYLKQRFLSAVSDAIPELLHDDGSDPHLLLGFGGSDDLLVKGRLAVRDAVLERIDWLGCAGRA
jgi:ketose-bisphosphate aldolase